MQRFFNCIWKLMNACYTKIKEWERINNLKLIQ